MRLLLTCHDMRNNALGRAYVWWLIAQELDWDVAVIGPTQGGLWQPVEGTPFAAVCAPGVGSVESLAMARRSDAIVAIKTWPRSFGTALDLGERTDTPVLLDIDDPDYDALLGRLASPAQKLRNAASTVVQRKGLLSFRRLQQRCAEVPRTVSNPVLASWHGGTVVPHVRPRPPLPLPPPDRQPLTVGFVGTPRGHKGLDHIRRLVADAQNRPDLRGTRLLVTGQRPGDAAPWELWTGPTRLDRLWDVLGEIDVVVVPSGARSYAPAQLPAKLIDAMMAGRAVIASDHEPARWALGGTGRLVPVGDERALRTAFRQLVDPDTRTALGAAASERAARMFTPASVAPLVARTLASLSV